MSTIDIENVAALLGRDITADEQARALRLLDIAEGVVSERLRGFSFVQDSETVEFTVPDLNAIWTPKYPVTEVSELKVNGAALSPSLTWTVTDVGHVLWDYPRQRWVWPQRAPRIELTYSFGLDPPPFVIVERVAAAVAAVLRRQQFNETGAQTTSETLGAYSHSETFAAGYLTDRVDVDLSNVGRWNRTAFVSVPMVAS